MIVQAAKTILYADRPHLLHLHQRIRFAETFSNQVHFVQARWTKNLVPTTIDNLGKCRQTNLMQGIFNQVLPAYTDNKIRHRRFLVEEHVEKGFAPLRLHLSFGISLQNLHFRAQADQERVLTECEFSTHIHCK